LWRIFLFFLKKYDSKNAVINIFLSYHMEIKNTKYEDYTKTIANNSVDFVCIDPPYTDGKTDVLAGHKIQTKIDISHVVSEAYRIAKDNSFFAVFGQMPTIAVWHTEILKAGFEWKEDITWVKRKPSNQYLEILRQKELIYIYSKGQVKFNKTKGNFDDLKIPLLLHKLYDIDSCRKYLQARYINKTKIIIDNSKTNDTIYKSEQKSSNRAPDLLNFTNVWSFLPQNKAIFNKYDSNTKHPTVKPTKLLERLIELCTLEPTKAYKPIVCDYFLGSGTTAIASVNTNRDFKGCEMDTIYYENEIIPRVNKAIQNHNSDMFKVADFGVLNCL